MYFLRTSVFLWFLTGMTMWRNRTPRPSRCVETKVYRVQARGADALLLPRNAVEDAFWTRRVEVDALFETLDGKRSCPRFVAAWNNKEGEYDGELDRVCRRRFGFPFVNIRSMWNCRLGFVDDYWFLVEAEEA